MSLENSAPAETTATPSSTPTENSPTSTPSSETSIVTPPEKVQPSDRPAETPTTEKAPEAITEDKLPEATPTEEEYELELAEDSPLSEAELKEIAEEAGRLNLPKEDAQKLIALKEDAYKKGASTAEQKYTQKLQDHFQQMSTHPEFTGEAAAESWKFLNKAVASFGDPELIELLKTPEVGNLVPLAKFLKKVGMAMAPDSTPPGGKGAASSPEIDEATAALRKQYPSFFENK